MLEKAGRI